MPSVPLSLPGGLGRIRVEIKGLHVFSEFQVLALVLFDAQSLVEFVNSEEGLG